MDNPIKQWTIALMIWMRLMSDIECFEKVTRNLFCNHMKFNCLRAKELIKHGIRMKLNVIFIIYNMLERMKTMLVNM